MTDVHSCSYYCDRPKCIKAQRDELRDRMAQPEQEPVAWMDKYVDIYKDVFEVLSTDTPLYTAPPQRKPLTDEQLEAMAEKCVTNCYFDTLKFARAIEAAHGIKENT